MDVEDLMDLCLTTQHKYTCKRGPRPSGALIYTDSGQLVQGTVIPPEGSQTCKEIGCMIEDGHCVRNNHAEVDAIINAARQGITTLNAWIFSINKPCYACTRAIITAGITRVYYAHTVYDEERTQLAAANANLEMIHVQVQ